MEGDQFDILLIVLYCSSLKLISSLISYLKTAMNIMEICLTECNDGLKLPNEYKYSSKRNVYNGLGGLFHLTIRPGSLNIYMWPYSFELYHSMRGSISFEQRMLFEWARFESFQKAPETLRMWKIKLSKNGFYYTGSGNNCKCAFCGVVYGNWRYTDDPEEVHRRLSPNCPLVHDRMNTNNIPINARERLQEQSAALSLAGIPNHTAVWYHGHVSRYQTREDIPGPNVRNELQNLMITIRRFEEEFDAIRSVSTQHVVDMQRARNHNYVQLDTRIESFGNWPSSNQAPRNLAQAGFYYTGEDDCCRCFFCDGCLRNWEPGDDPWVEHARLIPNCDFVRKCKGDEFVNSIQQQAELNDPGNSSENDVNSSNTTNSVETSPLSKGLIDWQNVLNTNLGMQEQSNTVARGSPQHVEEQAKYPNYAQLDTRIGTFVNWLSNHQTPRDLAEAGFFYTGKDDCCRCFFCGGGLRNWEPGDDPWVEHAQWFPKCNFVRKCKGDEFSMIQQLSIGLIEWQNVLNTNLGMQEQSNTVARGSPQNVEEQAKYPNYAQLDTRIGTFVNWLSNHQTPRDLAEAGFFYTGKDDCCRCFFCGGGLRNWEPGDDPWVEHAQWFPKCNFVRKCKGDEFSMIQQLSIGLNEWHNLLKTNLGMQEQSNTVARGSPQHVVEQAKYPNYAQLDLRIESFGNWPSNNVAPRDLAEAGFFYTGVDGTCRCFSCDVGLRHFDSDDVPWVEHARFSPKCNFVRKCKGDEFVNMIQQLLPVIEVQAENHRLKDGLKCLKCHTNRICMMFIPCAHTITCEDCSKIIQRCFKCNKVVEKAHKVLLSQINFR